MHLGVWNGSLSCKIKSWRVKSGLRILIGGLVTEFLTVLCFFTLGGVLAISLFLVELRGRNQCVPPLNTCVQPPIPTNPAQLHEKISCRNFNADNGKKGQKMTHFHWKKCANKQLFVSFWACMDSIFHARQFFINSGHILDIFRAKKIDWFFTPFQPLFHHQADFRKL